MISLVRRVQLSVAWSNGDPSAPRWFGAGLVVAASVTGRVDSRTGLVINITDLNRCLRDAVVDPLTGMQLNARTGATPGGFTHERLLLWMVRALTTELPQKARLHELILEAPGALFTAELPANDPYAKEPVVLLVTHTYEFSAAHRLYSAKLSPDENEALFGKCNNPNGHGHNYVLDVTVAGPMDDATGKVIEPGALDAIVHTAVVDRYDHRNLNLDLPEFKDTIPSSENIVQRMWDVLSPLIPSPVRLHKITLHETRSNAFTIQESTTE
ncbi:MAG: 6-carboxytetrahydropterin synthase [Armatimonadetes bacterium]|nr:6-carboxytetrahydropterin synthase [Armatimonadota bacterium]MDE2207091.1 6-carboxytetrahydropterin synthase [Armatimonadota bacterium]